MIGVPPMARLIIVEDNHELAQLVASAARSRGHTALAAHSGQAAMEALELAAYDAAVVDLLLPDMRGTDVLAVLQRRKIPAFAVSGVYRGDRFAKESTEVYGAKAFFEKPFDMRALLDAVEQALGIANDALGQEDLEALEELTPIEDADAPILPGPGKVVEGTEAASTPPVPDGDEPLGETESIRPADDPLGEDEITRPSGDLNALLAKSTANEDDADGADGAEDADDASDEKTETSAPPALEVLPAESVIELGSDDEVTRPNIQVSELLARAELENANALPFAERGKVWGAKDRAQAHAGENQTSGEVRNSPVPRLLTAYYQARHTGELRLKQDSVQKVVEFERGLPVYAASNVATERFARFCVKKGVVPESELSRIAAYSREHKLRTGVAMERLGMITAEQRRKLLEDQVREIIWSTFAWTRGEYQFAPRAQVRADLVKLSVFPGNLILEGVLRTSTLVTLRQKLTPGRRLFPCADPPYELHQIALTGPQASLLVTADGSKTVEDLLALTDLSERDALAALWAFELLGLVVERRDEGKAKPKQRISFGL